MATARGFEWFSEAWTLFKASPGTWVAIFVIFMVLSIVLAILPLGSLLSSLCYPAVVAGIMIGCRSLEEGGELEVGHLFAGFKQNLGNLAPRGRALPRGLGDAHHVRRRDRGPVMLPPDRGRVNFNNSDPTNVLLAFAPHLLLVLLVVLALTLPLFMAMWFAPALVIFHDVQPMAAMSSSFQGCLRNIMPFLVYGIVGLAALHRGPHSRWGWACSCSARSSGARCTSAIATSSCAELDRHAAPGFAAGRRRDHAAPRGAGLARARGHGCSTLRLLLASVAAGHLRLFGTVGTASCWSPRSRSGCSTPSSSR